VFFDAAVRNFGAAGASARSAFDGWLLFTESAGDNYCARWRDSLDSFGPWSFEATAEPLSLVARRGDKRLMLVAGRQVVTREGIEVLALASPDSIPDGNTLEATLDRVKTLGALAVLPWGFGKWTGSRGRRVRELFDESSVGLCLGDNGGRLGLAAEPALFARARAASRWVLPGSDPLPLAHHEPRAGSYGFVLPGTPDAERPAAWMFACIAALSEQPRSFGRLAQPWRFCLDQIAMQWKKRRR